MRRCFFSLAMAVVLSVGAGQAAAQPDLRIPKVWVNGNVAVVQVHNQGNMGAGACVLRMAVIKKADGTILFVGNQFVPALAMGQRTVITITAPFRKVAAHEWRFRVDATNVVAESNELNNRFSVP